MYHVPSEAFSSCDICLSSALGPWMGWTAGADVGASGRSDLGEWAIRYLLKRGEPEVTRPGAARGDRAHHRLGASAQPLSRRGPRAGIDWLLIQRERASERGYNQPTLGIPFLRRPHDLVFLIFHLTTISHTFTSNL